MFVSRVAQNYRDRPVPAAARKDKRKKTWVFVWRAATRTMSTRNTPTSKVGMFLVASP